MNNEKLGGFKFLKWMILIAVSVGIGILIATKTNILIKENRIGLTILIVFGFVFAFLILGIILNSIFAELGSVLFGKITGYKLVFLKLGTKKYVNENGKLIKKKFTVNSQVCVSIMEPPEMKDDKFPYKLMTYGDIITYVLIAIIDISLFFLFVNISQFIALVFLTFGFASLLQADFKVFPNISDLSYNSSYVNYKLRRNKELTKTVYNTMKINSLMAKDISLRDIDEKYFYLPEIEKMNNPIETGMAIFYYMYLKSANRFDEAIKIGKILLSSSKISMIGMHKLLLLADQIYDDCLQGNNGQAALNNNDYLFEKYSKALNTIPQIIRARYAYEVLVNNNYEKAQKDKLLFYRAYANYPSIVEVEKEPELFEKIDQIYKERNNKE